MKFHWLIIAIPVVCIAVIIYAVIAIIIQECRQRVEPLYYSLTSWEDDGFSVSPVLQ